MNKFLRFLPSREYLFIIFLLILVTSIGLISISVSNIRDPRSQAATGTATKLPGVVENLDIGPGNLPWWNLNNVKVKDSPGAQTFTGWGTDFLIVKKFGFKIPTGATITSIVVEIERFVVKAGAVESVSLLNANGLIATICNNNCSLPNVITKKTYTYTGTGGGPSLINRDDFMVRYSGNTSVAETTFFVDYIQVTVNYNYTPVSLPPTPPPPDDGGTSGGDSSGGSSVITPSGSDNFKFPSLQSLTGSEIDPNIVNLLKLNLSVPFIQDILVVPLIVNGKSQELELFPGVSEYEVDISGAKIPIGKEFTVVVGGNKVLTKKVKVKPKAPKQPVKFGTLYLGDTNRDNKINDEDINTLLNSLKNDEISTDINLDGVLNSLDWAILLANFGRIGNR